MKIIFPLISLLLVSSSTTFADGGYPGLPPDCWTESRNVHGGYAVEGQLKELFDALVSIEKSAIEGNSSFENLSPNNAYSFSVVGSRPDVRISIFAEKDHAAHINLKEVFGVSDAKWVNEKLIFFRIWWGRLMFTDTLFDVENETFIYKENGMDGFMAYQQFQASCRKVGGCRCIEKEDSPEK